MISNEKLDRMYRDRYLLGKPGPEVVEELIEELRELRSISESVMANELVKLKGEDRVGTIEIVTLIGDPDPEVEGGKLCSVHVKYGGVLRRVFTSPHEESANIVSKACFRLVSALIRGLGEH